MKPGIHDNITNDEYHSGPGISTSGLKLILRSPKKYWDKYINPDSPKDTGTKAMLHGRIGHKLLLEPDEFFEDFAVAPKVDKRTKDGKAAWALFEKQSEGKELIDTGDFEAIKTMTDAAREHPSVCKLVRNGIAERSIYWTDAETGVLCKCRPDYLRPEVIIDYKTCQNAEITAFGRDSFNYGYHIQDPFYTEGVKQATGDDLQFLFIAQEKASPYEVAVYSLEQSAKDLGKKLIRKALRIYFECLERDEWPGLPQQVQRLTLPAWAYKENTDD